jgi:ribokinase
VLAQLANERIGAKFVTETPGFQTGAAAILLDAAGNNAIIGIPGACAAVTAADVRTAESVIRTASVVVSTLEIPGDAVATMFHLARQAGAITILNPAPVFSLPNEVLGLVDYWIPNEVELGMICGSPARELGEIESLGRKCLQRGPKNVIVTLGDRGAMYIREDETSLIPAERVSAVDSTGAGDTFIGCFATCLAIGFDPIAAIAHANRAAGVTVTRMGAQGALPYRTELGW